MSITDFEEVVRLDTEYISNWNFGLDMAKEVTFKASAAAPRLYRIKFGRDIYKDLRQLEKSVGENDDYPYKELASKVILTNFDRIKLDERAYIKHEISTLV